MAVEFNLENLTECLCDSCPVQEKSKTVRDKMKMMQEITQEDVDSRIMIEEERIPALYCAKGKDYLEESGSGNQCQCDKCLVWKENNLFSGEPPGYFCRDGKARE
ncbi:DUF2769 domain-containing protein [Methanobacterium sp. BAmetb5]|jgi:hypothetical protein|uniref:DUF2769 domain-containing protein n=1 Tax=Methanobacterium sp. BAmetb5 TaxID=2025351 RepID=UPI000E8F7B34|nr:DUF2769 domain-containing protein [Methanobacterium sp. BAmetb5]AXV39484.1 MAG: DUF2769 domain-containing protein [Methanobacterium sp. BAmetb5]